MAFDFINTLVASDCNAVLVRDTRNLWFLDGVVGLEGIDQFRSKLAEVASEYDRIVTIGSSMGGFAAILYGTLLFADQILAIVPQVRVGSLARTDLGDTRWPGHFADIDGLEGATHLRALDRLNFPRRTRVHAIYGDLDDADNRHKAALENTPVRIVTVRGADHNGAAGAALKGNIVEMVL